MKPSSNCSERPHRVPNYWLEWVGYRLDLLNPPLERPVVQYDALTRKYTQTITEITAQGLCMRVRYADSLFRKFL